VICPNCGWFITGEQTVMDEVNEDMFKTYQAVTYDVIKTGGYYYL